jgi:hypothetical protein
VADLPLKSGKSVVIFPFVLSLLKALAIMFKPPNGKPYGY